MRALHRRGRWPTVQPAGARGDPFGVLRGAHGAGRHRARRGGRRASASSPIRPAGADGDALQGAQSSAWTSQPQCRCVCAPRCVPVERAGGSGPSGPEPAGGGAFGMRWPALTGPLTIPQPARHRGPAPAGPAPQGGDAHAPICGPTPTRPSPGCRCCMRAGELPVPAAFFRGPTFNLFCCAVQAAPGDAAQFSVDQVPDRARAAPFTFFVGVRSCSNGSSTAPRSGARTWAPCTTGCAGGPSAAAEVGAAGARGVRPAVLRRGELRHDQDNPSSRAPMGGLGDPAGGCCAWRYCALPSTDVRVSWTPRPQTRPGGARRRRAGRRCRLVRGPRSSPRAGYWRSLRRPRRPDARSCRGAGLAARATSSPGGLALVADRKRGRRRRGDLEDRRAARSGEAGGLVDP